MTERSKLTHQSPFRKQSPCLTYTLWPLVLVRWYTYFNTSSHVAGQCIKLFRCEQLQKSLQELGYDGSVICLA